MKFRYDGFNWLVRLEKGEKLVECLIQLATSEHITSCWVSGIGGALLVELGFYDLKSKEYQWREVNELMEITSLGGNLVWDGEKPLWHLHGTFAKSDLSAIGGHVKELVVGGTCEVLLHKWYGDNLSRSKNDEVGLKLLDL